MNPLKVGPLCAGLVFVLVCVTGCSKKPPSQSAAAFQDEFKSTKPEVKGFAQQAVVAEEQQDYATAFVHYRALSLNPDLTPEQRNSANEAMQQVNKKLRERATNGDVNAEQVLEMYRATK